MGNPRGQLPSGITGTGSLVGPPASSRPSSSQAMLSPSASSRLKGTTGMLRTPVEQSIPEFGLNVEPLPSSSPSLGLGLGLGLGVPMPPPLPPPPRKMPLRRRWLAAFDHSTGLDSVISGTELALEEGLAASQTERSVNTVSITRTTTVTVNTAIPRNTLPLPESQCRDLTRAGKREAMSSVHKLLIGLLELLRGLWKVLIAGHSKRAYLASNR